MIKRISTGWNIQRLLFLLIGGSIVYQAYIDQEWLAVGLGTYFMSMGLFAFGCASGYCYGGSCENTPEKEVVKNE